MAKKNNSGEIYAVWRRGYSLAIYDTWDQCKRHVNGVSGANNKKCGSIEEAEQWHAERTAKDDRARGVRRAEQSHQPPSTEEAIHVPNGSDSEHHEPNQPDDAHDSPNGAPRPTSPDVETTTETGVLPQQDSWQDATAAQCPPPCPMLPLDTQNGIYFAVPFGKRPGIYMDNWEYCEPHAVGCPPEDCQAFVTAEDACWFIRFGDEAAEERKRKKMQKLKRNKVQVQVQVKVMNDYEEAYGVVEDDEDEEDKAAAAAAAAAAAKRSTALDLDPVREDTLVFHAVFVPSRRAGAIFTNLESAEETYRESDDNELLSMETMKDADRFIRHRMATVSRNSKRRQAPPPPPPPPHSPPSSQPPSPDPPAAARPPRPPATARPPPPSARSAPPPAASAAPPSSQSFFEKTPGFKPNPTAELKQEYGRWALDQDLSPNDPEYGKQFTRVVAHELVYLLLPPKYCLEAGYNLDRMTDKLKLMVYQGMCRSLGIKARDTMEKCTYDLKTQVLVNLVDFVDAQRTGKQLRTWRLNQWGDFKSYTMREGKCFSLEAAKENGGFLMALLQDFKNGPRVKRSDGRPPAPRRRKRPRGLIAVEEQPPTKKHRVVLDLP